LLGEAGDGLLDVGEAHRSALRSTGVTRPLSVATAIEMSAVAVVDDVVAVDRGIDDRVALAARWRQP
jgi:hypothetical protein